MSMDLGKFELLQELDDEQRGELAPFLVENSMRVGEFIFRCNEEGAALHLLSEGSVRLELKGRELGLVKVGESIGAVSLVVIGNRQCDALAVSETTLLTLSREAYLRLRADAPAVALALQEGILRTFSGFLRCTVADRRTPANGGA